MGAATFAQRRLVTERIDRVFTVAAKQRQKRPVFEVDLSDAYGLTVPGWVLYERQQMFEAVNTERSYMGIAATTLDKIVRAENCAKGHSDYQRKFVLYCTELVFDD